ncbi:MAG: hypothetical protein OSJ27_07705 [Candidatus Gastranaerophilales bacterium]|nr:hypothetical protein [Candidatus Gastranaerophilales bacterium]
MKRKEKYKQLCDNSSGYGALQCYPHYSSGCPGAQNNNCYPAEVWASTANGSNRYKRALNGGSFNENNISVTYALGVRCVPDLNQKTHSNILVLNCNAFFAYDKIMAYKKWYHWHYDK